MTYMEFVKPTDSCWSCYYLGGAVGDGCQFPDNPERMCSEWRPENITPTSPPEG